MRTTSRRSCARPSSGERSCSRTATSTWSTPTTRGRAAYQGTGRGLGADEVERLSLWAARGLLPHVTVLLDLDPAVGLARLTGDPDRLESAGADFHRRTRDAFLARAAQDPDRWLVLDASQPAEDLAAQVRARLAPLLGGDA